MGEGVLKDAPTRRRGEGRIDMTMNLQRSQSRKCWYKQNIVSKNTKVRKKKYTSKLCGTFGSKALIGLPIARRISTIQFILLSVRSSMTSYAKLVEIQPIGTEKDNLCRWIARREDMKSLLPLQGLGHRIRVYPDYRSENDVTWYSDGAMSFSAQKYE